MPSPEDIREHILALVKQYHQAKFASKAFDPDKDLVYYAGRVFWRTEQVNLVNNVPLFSLKCQFVKPDPKVFSSTRFVEFRLKFRARLRKTQ
jgi:hypothetical protein